METLNKRRWLGAVGATLYVLPFLTMDYLKNGDDGLSFLSLFMPKTIVETAFSSWSILFVPILPFLIASLLMNIFATKRKILTAFLALAAIGCHLLFYSFIKSTIGDTITADATIGMAFYIMGIGLVLNLVAPFAPQLPAAKIDNDPKS